MGAAWEIPSFMTLLFNKHVVDYAINYTSTYIKELNVRIFKIWQSKAL